MASKNQTPAPKASGKTEHNGKGQRQEPAIDHLESGYEKGVSPEYKDEGQLAVKTTRQQQEERSEKSDHARQSLQIPYGKEGEGKNK